MVLDLLNESFGEETTPKIDEIIGFPPEKTSIFVNLVSERVRLGP